MPLGSYWIESEHKYIGPSSGRSDAVRHINPKDIKSMQGESPGIHFTKEGVVRRTANNMFVTSYRDFGRNGYFSQVDDYGMGRWIKAGNGNPPSRHSIIAKMPSIAYIEGVKQLRANFQNPNDTPVPNYITPVIANIGPMNDTGRNVSKLENRRGNIRNFLWDEKGLRDETLAYGHVLSSFGLPLKRENPVYAIGIEHDVGSLGYVAAYQSNPAKRHLIFEAEFDKRIRSEAARLGIQSQRGIEALKRSDISHETIRHGMYEIGGDRADEHLQGLIGLKFHSDRAKEYEGTEEGRIHKKLAERERLYAQDFSFWQSIKDAITQSPHSTHGPKRRIAETVWQHGIALGKRGKELEKYVRERVDKIYNPLDDEPSYKKGGKAQGLDDIVGENEQDTTSDSKYEGRISKSEYKSMKDVREREAKSEKAENDAKAEAAEAN